MALKDIWKDKTDGVDDVLAEDINDIAKAVIQNEEDIKKKANSSDLEDKANKGTTLAEYGIEDAYTTEEVDAINEAIIENLDELNQHLKITQTSVNLLEENKADKVDTYTKEEVDAKDEVIKSDLVGKKAIPNGAEIFNDYENNDTNIPFAHIEGRNNKAVVKCFIITENTENSVTLDSVEGIEVGMGWNIFTPSESEIYEKYRGKVTAVVGNKVSIDATIPENIVSDKASFLNTFIVHGGTIGSTVIEDNELKAFTTHIAGEECIGYLDTITGGRGCQALAYAAMAIGYFTQVFGERGVGLGYRTVVRGNEGFACNTRGEVNGQSGFKSGSGGVVDADFGTVQGSYGWVKKSAIHAHAINLFTIATAMAQFVHGKFNIEDVKKEFAHIVGNGTSDEDRSNAYTLDWDGNGHFAGKVFVGPDKKEVALKEDLLTKSTETAKELTLNDSSDSSISSLCVLGDSAQKPTPPKSPDGICTEEQLIPNGIFTELFKKENVTAVTDWGREGNIMPENGIAHIKFNSITGLPGNGACVGVDLAYALGGFSIGFGQSTSNQIQTHTVENSANVYPAIATSDDLNAADGFELIIKTNGQNAEYFLKANGANGFKKLGDTYVIPTNSRSTKVLVTNDAITFDMAFLKVYELNPSPTPKNPFDVISIENPKLTITDDSGNQVQEVTIPYTLMGLKNKNGVFEARDEIVVENGKVKLIQRCNKYFITPKTQIANFNATSTGLYYQSFAPTPYMKKSTRLAGYGNFMPNNVGGWNAWRNETVYFGQANAQVYIITSEKYTSSEELYNYLSNNGANEIYVIYQLATPIETDITDTACGQALLKLYTNYPSTVISCDTDFNISYKADTTNAYNNLLGELDTLKQAIINLGGTI